MTEHRMRWKWIAIVWVFAIVLGAAVGVALGWVSGPEPGPELPSPDQQRILGELGDPPAFFVGDGPVAEDGEWHRIEVWSYPSDGTDFEFFDGVLVDERPSSTSVDITAATVSPPDLGREHTRADIEHMLGEGGTPLERTGEMWDGLEPVLYESARLVVGYLDGRLYVVETF